MAGIAVVALLVATAVPPARADGGGAGGSYADTGITFTGGPGGPTSTGLGTGGGGGGGAGTTGDGAAGNAGATGGAGGGGGPGGGGGGGAGGALGSTAGVVSSAVAGGDGSGGGDAFPGAGGGGGGGGGGYGVVTGSLIVNASGSVSGGAGGAGAAGGTGGGTTHNFGGSGGDGGIGVFFTGSGTLDNSGTITGGAGGSRGAAGTGGSAGAAGVDGAGVVGAGLSITNSGSISGGGGANAITFTGGTNTLTLQSGFSITGNVVGTGGDTLALGGTGVATLDTSRIGPAAQYQGFSTFQKTGTGEWDLTNTTTAVTPWTITAGLLRITNDAALGDTSGRLTFDGGTLQLGAGISSSRNVTITGNNGTIDTNTTSAALSGTISGTGGLTETGGGLLDLSGANTYSGGTTISNGVLQVGIDTVGTPGAITSSAIGTGTLTFDSGVLEAFAANLTIANAGKVNNTGGEIDVGGSGTFTYSGAIADGDGSSGTLTIIDSSGGGGETVIFSGANTYGAATLVSGGANAVTLKGGASNSFSPNSAMTVDAGGTIDLGGFGQTIGSLAGAGNVTNSGGSNATLTAGGNNSSTTFSGVISDGAHTTALTKAGTGTFILTGANTYTGATTVTGGKLEIGVGGSIAAGHALAVNGGIFDLNDQNLTVGQLSGTGGTIQLGTGTLTGGDNTNTILAAAITGNGGSGFIKQGTGTLILDGVNTFTGSTTINAGTLEIGDASHPSASLAGNVTVGASAMLMGHGTIGGAVTNIAGGIVAPGGSIGTLTVASYTQGLSSTLLIEVSPSAASKLAVTGTASLNGTLALVYDPGVYSATTYNIVHAGTITGTFSTVNSSGSTPSNLAQSVTYSGTDVNLVLTGSTSLIVAPTNDSVYGSLDTSALLGGQQANTILLGHLADMHSGTGSDTIHTALAATAPTQLAVNGGAMHLNDAVAQLPDAMAQLGGWFRATGAFAKLSGTSSNPGFNTQGGGFMAGLDRPVADNLTAGIAAGYSHTNLGQTDGENGTLDTPRVAAYGSYTMGPWGFDATIGYAYDSVSAKRPLTGIGTASSTHDAHEATGAAQASYRFDYAGLAVMPSAGIAYVHLFDGGSNETGAGGFDLNISHRNSDSLRPFIGASVTKVFTTDGGMRLVPEADISYSHELFATAPTLAQVGGGTFSVVGIAPAHDLLTIGTGTTATINDRLDLFADYHVTLPTGNFWQQTVTAGARYKF